MDISQDKIFPLKTYDLSSIVSIPPFFGASISYIGLDGMLYEDRRNSLK